MYHEKAKLLVWKSEHGLPRAICPEDVMPIVNQILFKANGNKTKNHNATSEDGWFLPNIKLLEQSSLVTKQKKLF